MNKYIYEQNRNDYLTPPEIIEITLQRVRFRTGEDVKEFDLDVCCSFKNIPARKHFLSTETNGLLENWESLNWCNPPFDECKKWVQKAYFEQQKGNSTIMFIPVRTETEYWHFYILHNPRVEIDYLRKGLKFINPDTNKPMGIFKNALALVYFW